MTFNIGPIEFKIRTKAHNPEILIMLIVWIETYDGCGTGYWQSQLLVFNPFHKDNWTGIGFGKSPSVRPWLTLGFLDLIWGKI